MKNCPLLQHLPEEERVASKVVYADEGEEAGNGRKLQQVGGAKTYNTGNPNTKVPFLDVAAPPSNFGAVSGFQFYRDLYCQPPSVSPATFNFVSSTSFTGVTYAFAILGGSANWDPKTQILTVNKPQVLYSKTPSGWAKSGGSTSKGSASEKACSFSSAIQKKSGEGISYTTILGITEEFVKPTAGNLHRCAKPETRPPQGLVRCWTDSNHPECSPPDIGLSPLLLNLLCRPSACCQGSGSSSSQGEERRGRAKCAASKKIATKHLYLSESFFLSVCSPLIVRKNGGRNDSLSRFAGSPSPSPTAVLNVDSTMTFSQHNQERRVLLRTLQAEDFSSSYPPPSEREISKGRSKVDLLFRLCLHDHQDGECLDAYSLAELKRILPMVRS